MKTVIELVAALEAALEDVEQTSVSFKEEAALIELGQALARFQAKVA